MNEQAKYELRGKRVWVAGHGGMVGGAIGRRLAGEGCEILIAPRDKIDLRNQSTVSNWLSETKPQAVFVAAAKVGGIHANDTHPAEFLRDNLMIEANVIHAAHEAGVEKLLFLGSSCVYPKYAEQPISEDALLTGSLEPTNEWYAVAKIAGIKLCQAYRRQYGCDFVSAMPTNLYGPGDNFDLQSSHVIPALMRKAHEAKISGADKVTIWGSGTSRREFLHVDDCADALVHLMRNYSDDQHINVGFGSDMTIEELACLVNKVVGFSGAVEKDMTKPDGTPVKLLDCARLSATGWQASIALEEGLLQTYSWFLEHRA